MHPRVTIYVTMQRLVTSREILKSKHETHEALCQRSNESDPEAVEPKFFFIKAATNTESGSSIENAKHDLVQSVEVGGNSNREQNYKNQNQ